MRQHRFSQLLDVVRDHVRPAQHCGQGLAGVEKVQRPAGARTQRHLGIAARAADQAGDVLAQLRLDEHLAHRALRALELVRRHDGLQLQHRRLDLALPQQVGLFLLGQVTEPHLHQEPVELGFGKRESSRVFDRVLRRHDHEGLGQVVRVPVDGDLALLHRLQEGCLGLRAGAS